MGDKFELEALAGLNRNLFPWKVASLTTLRGSQKKDFALAFEHLALRRCTITPCWVLWA